MITAIVEELRAAHPSRAIELECPPEVQGCWDRDRLEQVFSNLIGNAIQHGDPGRPVVIRVDDDGEQAVISVHNDGAPIPEPVRAEIFSAFRRGERDGNANESAGLGLGLYISREIIVAHGGDIELESTELQGTTFRVRLPRAIDASSAEVKRQNDPAGALGAGGR
jgi:signal transduction histidine kinase